MMRARRGVLLPAAVIAGSLLIAGGVRSLTDSRPSVDPLTGIHLFVDPDTPAAKAAASLGHSDPADAKLLRKVASQPAGTWFGAWNSVTQVSSAVQTVMREAASRQQVPLLVLYAFPDRGCASDATAAAAYPRWIGQVVKAIGKGKAVVVLEPDALAEYIRLGCLSPTERQGRLELIRQAVDQLVTLPNAVVYVDAGNARWQPASVMASLLLAVDVEKARGFSLNVSNFDSTGAEEAYGDKLAGLLHGMHYVIDVSRNGTATATTWCNPAGQGLGVPPTAATGAPSVDGLLWIKPPWASDGTCDGGPPAGDFWLPYTLKLAANARW